MIGGGIPGKTEVISVRIYQQVEALQCRRGAQTVGWRGDLRLPAALFLSYAVDRAVGASGARERGAAVERRHRGALRRRAGRLPAGRRVPAGAHRDHQALSGSSGRARPACCGCTAGLTRLPGKLCVDGEVCSDERASSSPRIAGRWGGVPGAQPARPPAGAGQPGACRGRRPADLTRRPRALAWLLLARATGALGGERQRVALGRALVTSSSALIYRSPASTPAPRPAILPDLAATRTPVILVPTSPRRRTARPVDWVLLMADGRVTPRRGGDGEPGRCREVERWFCVAAFCGLGLSWTQGRMRWRTAADDLEQHLAQADEAGAAAEGGGDRLSGDSQPARDQLATCRRTGSRRPGGGYLRRATR